LTGLLLTLLAASACENPATVRAPEPFFEVWDEDNVYGVLDVALDGTVLLFSLQGDPHPDKRSDGKIWLKRSEDGGETWSKHEQIGESFPLDWETMGIGPYDGSARGKEKHHGITSLGTSVVDENTGEITVFLTSLHPAPVLYKSPDHGKTWSLEKLEMEKDARGFLSVPNAACDPGITIRKGPHKGRLLVPSRVFPKYQKLAENSGYTNAIYSDDHGKTWHASEPFPLDGTGESGLVELRDGTIYLNSRTHTRRGNRWVAYSDDSGETWRDLHQDDELFDGPPDVYGCKAGLLRLDRDDRDILLFSSPTPSLPKRQNIRVWVSFDGGKSWPHQRLIKRGPGNYTWLAEGRRGTPSEGFIYLLSGKDWMARFNLAWLLQVDSPEIVLSWRDRLRFTDDDVYRSSENVEPSRSTSARIPKGTKGYRVKSDADSGVLRTHRFRLPSSQMRVSYNAPSGRLMVLLMDESDTRVRDSHWLSGDYEVDQPIPWQDGPISQWVGQELYVQFRLEGDAEVFDVSFEEVGDDPKPPGSSRAADDDFVLPPRNDYVVGETPSFIASAEGARSFRVVEPRLERIRSGYCVIEGKRQGEVRSRSFSLPSEEMKITCDVSSGSLRVFLLDAAGAQLAASKPIRGGLEIGEPVEWLNGFELAPVVSTTVSVRFEMEGDAELYALRFDDLFWE